MVLVSKPPYNNNNNNNNNNKIKTWRRSQWVRKHDTGALTEQQTLTEKIICDLNILNRDRGSLICSHRSLLLLLRPARFAYAFRCARFFACLLTSLTPSLVGQWMMIWLFILCFILIWPIVQWLLLSNAKSFFLDLISPWRVHATFNFALEVE